MSEVQAIPTNLTERLIRLEIAQENRDETHRQILEILNTGLSTMLRHFCPDDMQPAGTVTSHLEDARREACRKIGITPPPSADSATTPRLRQFESAMICDTGTATADGHVRVALEGREGFQRTELSFEGSSTGLRITQVSLGDTILVANDKGLPPMFIADHLLYTTHPVLWKSGFLVVEGVLPQAGDRMVVSVVGEQARCV